MKALIALTLVSVLAISFSSDRSGAAKMEGEDVWLAHYTREGGGFQTAINLVNPSFGETREATLTPYAADGTPLDGLARIVAAPPGHRVALTRADLGWQDMPVSHVRVAAPGLGVTAAYAHQAEGAMTAEVPLDAVVAADARFAPVVGASWFDGFVVVNPGDQPARFVATAHDAMGNTLQSTPIDLPAFGKWLGLEADLFDEGLEIDGYIQFRSDQALAYMGLRGSLPGVSPPVLTEVRPDRGPAVDLPALSFANQAARIIQRKCADCHHEGGIGPFPLQRYDEVYAIRDFVAQAVASGEMPPWKADDACLEVKDSLAIHPHERQMLLDWLDAGAPEGEPERAPAPIEYPDSQWTMGEPDLALQYDESYVYEPGPDVYRCFPMAVNNSDTLQLGAIEILPGNPEIVHHVLVFLDEGESAFQMDQQEDGPGYTCFGGPGTGSVRLIAGWAPGSAPQRFADDVAITLPPNATLVVQVHYHFSTVGGPDQTRVGLSFTPEERDKELLLLPLVNSDFVIPAGAKGYQVSASVDIPSFISAELYAVFPHMHLLGQDISLQATFPDGSESCLVNIPKWDFDWQRFYEYPQPLHLPGGTRLRMECHYDNSRDNPYNPNSPPAPVGWGEATTDEMALMFLGVVLPIDILNKRGDGWVWPFEALTPPTSPAAIKRSLDRKRAVPKCCDALKALDPGVNCANQ